jgi:hypothetical protein
LAGPALDGVLNGIESRQTAGPAARAGWLEDQAGDVLATHTLIGADGFYAFATTGTSKIQDVSEFAAVCVGDTHCREDNVEAQGVQYQ